MKLAWQLGMGALAFIAVIGATPVYAGNSTPDDDGLKCRDDEEREGDLCYVRCKDDGYTRYEGEGEICWQVCPPNSQDHGNVCLTGPAQLRKKKFSRGPGRPLK